MNECGYNVIEVNNNEILKNKESFNVYHCEECNQSYEVDKCNNKIYYHDDFPTFGLDRKTCCNCK